jgi:glycerol-3-phosphate acyltransferase PlsY
VPIGLYLVKASCAFVLMASFITLFILIRHKDNISRLLKGTESKLSFSGGSKK